ncbi:hypothetical protein FQZ97_867990 [compost metagenome]
MPERMQAWRLVRPMSRKARSRSAKIRSRSMAASWAPVGAALKVIWKSRPMVSSIRRLTPRRAAIWEMFSVLANSRTCGASSARLASRRPSRSMDSFGGMFRFFLEAFGAGSTSRRRGRGFGSMGAACSMRPPAARNCSTWAASMALVRLFAITALSSWLIMVMVLKKEAPKGPNALRARSPRGGIGTDGLFCCPLAGQATRAHPGGEREEGQQVAGKDGFAESLLPTTGHASPHAAAYLRRPGRPES